MQRYLMEKWLNSRGGRTLDDLRNDYDGLGFYVFMGDGKGGLTKVHLVDDIKLSRDLMVWKKDGKNNR